MNTWAFYAAAVLLVLSVASLIPIPGLESKGRRSVRKRTAALALMLFLYGTMPEKASSEGPVKQFGAKSAFYACDSQVSQSALFCGHKYRPACNCIDPNAVATMAHCYWVGYPDQVDSYLDICNSKLGANLTMENFFQALEYYNTSAREVSSRHHAGPRHLDLTFAPTLNLSLAVNLDHGPIVDHPVILNDALISKYKLAYDQFLGNYDRSTRYGLVMVGYWFSVLALAAAANFLRYLFPQTHRIFTGKISNWYRRTFTLSAMNKRKLEEKPFLKVLDMLVPTRLETGILAIFSIMMVIYLFKHIHYTEGDPIFHDGKFAYYRYYAVRSGLLATSVMPLLVLFAGRNNFLQWAVGWNYGTFVMYHRWISRAVVLLIFIHSVMYCLYLRQWYLSSAEFPRYVRYGILAGYGGFALIIQGLLVLRRKWYEAFLVLHILLAAIFIVGGYFHTASASGVWYYAISLDVWAFDRLMRIFRLCSFGFPLANVNLASKEVLKVSVPVSDNSEIVPGGHVFIHFLLPNCFWQSHPFTYTTQYAGTSGKIELFIKVKKGATEQIRRAIMAGDTRSIPVRVAVEGFYGEESPAAKYDTAVFVAGGNGIPGIFEEAVHLEKRRQIMNRQKIKLVWVVRDFATLYWFYEELLSLKNKDIVTTIFVTRPHEYPSKEEFEERFCKARETTPLLKQNILQPNLQPQNQQAQVEQVERVTKTKQELSHIEFIEGRPNMKQFVKTNVKESAGSTIFVPCAHPSMVDELRQSIATQLNQFEGKWVEFFEQLQVWA